MTLGKREAAEFIGTFWLVFGGCGSAVLAAAFPRVGIGLLGVALAFGLTVLTMAYAIGHISGCHLNPAVTVGLAAAGRFPAATSLPYIVAQVVGGDRRRGRALPRSPAGKPGFTLAGGFASNGYGEHSPGGYSLRRGAGRRGRPDRSCSCSIILGATDQRAPPGFAPIAIGLGLTLIHLIGIPRDEPLGEPRAQHRAGPLRRRLGRRAALALLGRADRRRAGRRDGLPDHRRARPAGGNGA